MSRQTLIIGEKLGSKGASFSTKLADEAILRGWQVFECEKDDIFLEDGKVFANVSGYPNSSTKRAELKTEFSAIHFRPNPPVDMGYLTIAYLLRIIEDEVLILNKPSAIINLPEKIFPHFMGDYSPPTLISQNRDEIIMFAKKHGEIVVKPLYGFGGFDIKKLNADEVASENLDEIFVYQKFMQEVREGTVRVNMLDGEIFGHFKKIPPKDTIESNFFDDDGLAEVELTDAQKHICEQLKGTDVFFSGVDFIGDKLLEVNVTSPGTLGVEEVCGLQTEKKYWDLVESRC